MTDWRNDRAKLLTAIKRRMQGMRATAQAATPGHWRRDHGVVTSVPPGRYIGYTICFPEVGTEISWTDYRAWLKAEPIDHARAMANSRHIVATQPQSVLDLLKLIELLVPELADTKEG